MPLENSSPVTLAATVRQITDLARVPLECRLRVCEHISELVANTQYNVGIPEDPKRLREQRNAFRRLRRARAMFRKAALELQLAVAACGGPVHPVDELSPKVLAVRSDVATMPVRPRRPGRPHGPVGDPTTGIIYSETDDQFFDLVICLLSIVKAAGGKLPFDKNSTSGSLVDALELLRPHLPSVIPNAIPVRKIVSARSFVKQGFGP